MLYLIDGTGGADDEVYRRDMSTGFMKRMEWEYNGEYFRGPSIDDLRVNTLRIAEDAFNHIVRDKRFGKEDLYLAGHSRGGYAVLIVAHKLGPSKVKAVFLFDAVDRALSVNGYDSLPNNVGMTYHAKRDYALSNYVSSAAVQQARSKFYNCARFDRKQLKQISSYQISDMRVPSPSDPCFAEWKKMREVEEEDLIFKWVMRVENVIFPDWFKAKYNADFLSINFGNCLANLKASDRYIPETFCCSHGAMGGAPIMDATAKAPLLRADREGMMSVWDWMVPRFEAEGLKRSPVTIPDILKSAVTAPRSET